MNKRYGRINLRRPARELVPYWRAVTDLGLATGRILSKSLTTRKILFPASALRSYRVEFGDLDTFPAAEVARSIIFFTFKALVDLLEFY